MTAAVRYTTKHNIKSHLLSNIMLTDMPSLSHKSKEHHEFQDMYRTNLTAFWSAQPGELRADECIEDIFAGGDGWGGRPSYPAHLSQNRDRTSEGDKHGHSDRQSHLKPPHFRHGSNGGARSASSHASQESTPRARASQDSTRYTPPVGSAVGGRSSLEQHANSLKADADARQERNTDEVDEFDLRDDLRSWTISQQAV